MFPKLVIFLLLTLCAHLSITENLVCYFTSWTYYRPGEGHYDTSSLPADLCTHIHYGFVGLNGADGRLVILDSYEANELEELNHLHGKKDENPNLKLIVSMGGWNEGSIAYSQVAADPILRKNLVDSVVQFLSDYGFDGFDLDWEYPNQRGGKEEDIENFITLLQELKQTLEPLGHTLSVAVSGGIVSADTSYDFSKLGQTVDLINVMAYDYHGAFESYVGHYAPLYASSLDKTDLEKQLNVHSGILHWLEKGVPAEKLTLGIGLYGRGFTLADPNDTSLYANVTGGCHAGPFTQSIGTLGYNEICEFYSDYEYFWDSEQQVPHIVKGDQWIGYDDIKSVELKTKFAKSLGLSGIMVWSLDTDDFRGTCGRGKYPLVNTIKKTWAES